MPLLVGDPDLALDVSGGRLQGIDCIVPDLGFAAESWIIEEPVVLLAGVVVMPLDFVPEAEKAFA